MTRTFFDKAGATMTDESEIAVSTLACDAYRKSTRPGVCGAAKGAHRQHDEETRS